MCDVGYWKKSYLVMEKCTSPAVSYTHLDVYKRQDNHTGRADGNSKTGHEEAGQCLRAAGGQDTQLLGEQPDHKIG